MVTPTKQTLIPWDWAIYYWQQSWLICKHDVITPPAWTNYSSALPPPPPLPLLPLLPPLLRMPGVSLRGRQAGSFKRFRIMPQTFQWGRRDRFSRQFTNIWPAPLHYIHYCVVMLLLTSAPHLGYNVPKEIHFPLYNMKCNGKTWYYAE